MNKGYYKSRFDRTGKQLEVRFFNPDVLDRYKNSPYYILSEANIATKYDVPKNVRRVGLQQYVWGKKKDKTPCIAVLLSHICRLDPQEQMYWKSHELSEKDAKQAKIEARYYKPMVQGKFPDVWTSFDVILPTLEFINKITSNGLFRKVLAHKPSFLGHITKNSRKEYMAYIQELDKLLSVNINETYLMKNIKSTDKNPLSEKGEILNLLGLWLDELGIAKNEITDCLESLKSVRKERNKPAHVLFEDDFAGDYILKQKQITLKVWKSLHKIARWLKPVLDINNSIKEPKILSDCRII